MKKNISEKTKKILLKAQKNEITEYFVYRNLAELVSDKKNQKILNKIANDELAHYKVWKSFTDEKVLPSKYLIKKYSMIARVFGLTFGLRLMEQGEQMAQVNYENLINEIPQAKRIIKDEEEHEQALIEVLNEEKLKYVGSVVLGLNDALVELTGVLAGLTFALQNTQLVALTGVVTGIAASCSMGASEYLSVKSEESGEVSPIKSAIYTGTAYLITVVFLVAPYFIFSNIYFCLAMSLFNAVLIIAIFNYYLAIARRLNFFKRFIEMVLVSMGVAAFSFGVGILARHFLGVAA